MYGPAYEYCIQCVEINTTSSSGYIRTTKISAATAASICKKNMIASLLHPRQGLESDPLYPLMVPGEPSHHEWQTLRRIKADFDEAVLAAATARSPLLSSSSSTSSSPSSHQQKTSSGGQGLGQGAAAPSSPRRRRFQYCRAEDRSVR